ncbi:hypothetical protein [Nocardiopsis composta]|uniref:Uncharacterized protein n=1 Tax=Nocardiopsis composta TaxID=157465 RepID=A0A7W8VCA1_9ACTN|nr:hypothetical protein [Nocardiopsis composta]MBB5430992.1 hypothetical protein [Nocardiopsis composta]
MEEQHRKPHSLPDTVTDRAERYGGTAAAEDVVGPMHGHLVREERNVLPLIDCYCTNEEWSSVGEHGLPRLTPTRVPLVFGMMPRAATEDQRAVLAGNIPDDVFSQMVQVAPGALNACERTLYGFDGSERPG